MKYADAEKQYQDMVILVHNGYFYSAFNGSAVILNQLFGYKLYLTKSGKLSTGGPNLQKIENGLKNYGYGYVVLEFYGKVIVHPGNPICLSQPLSYYSSNSFLVNNNVLSKSNKQKTKATTSSSGKKMMPSASVVKLNSVVYVTDIDYGTIQRYVIVPDDKANPAMGLMSINSNIGQSLIGRHVGDVVKIWLATGWYRVSIMYINP